MHDKILGRQKTFLAVMKHSPIWDRRQKNNYIELLKRKQKRNDSEDTEEDDIGMERIEKSLLRTTNYLHASYVDNNNPTYVDALGYYLGSLLVEYRVTPFFPLFYQSFLVKSSGRPGQEAAPELCTIIQRLDDHAFDPSNSTFFYDDKVRKPTHLNRNKLMAVLGQIVFGLNAAQEIFDLVNNDFHFGNLMYERVDQCTILYYRLHGTEKCWAIPTFGYVYKMIDFGRAHFRIGNRTITSADQLSDRWAPDNKSTDLHRLVSSLACMLGIDKMIDGSGREKIPGHVVDVVELMGRILSSSTEHANIFVMLRIRRENIPRDVHWRMIALYGDVDRLSDKEFRQKYRSYIFKIWPYEKETLCSCAVPARIVGAFDDVFRIGIDNIPKDAIVYTIF
jgi:hypothetical protein